MKIIILTYPFTCTVLWILKSYLSRNKHWSLVFQGHMDEDVQAALLQIIRMRQGFVCWTQCNKTTLTWIHHSHSNFLFSVFNHKSQAEPNSGDSKCFSILSFWRFQRQTIHNAFDLGKLVNTGQWISRC